MSRRHWTVALVAAALGYGLLVLLYPRLSPVAQWRYSLTRERAVRAAESVAARLGTDVSGWDVSYAVLATGDVSATYRGSRPAPPEIEAFVPTLHSHVVFTNSADHRFLRVRLANDGQPMGFAVTAPDSAPDARPRDIDIARTALTRLLDGTPYSQIAVQEPRSSTTEHGQQFTFTVPTTANAAEIALNAQVTVQNGVATHVAIGPTFTEQYRSQADPEDLVLRTLAIPSILAGVILWPAAIAFTVVSLLRRELDWRSSAGFIVFLLALSAVPVAAGSLEYARVRALVQPQGGGGITVSTNQGRSSRQVGQQIGQALNVWSPLLLVCVPFWVAGYPLGRRTAPSRVVTARDFFAGRVWQQPVGRSIAAGVLFGGLFAAVPYVVAALHVSPYAVLDADDPKPYGFGYQHPAIGAMYGVVDATLLILFAFAAPFIDEYVARRKLARALFVIVAGFWLVADTPFAVSATAALIAGTLTTVAAYFIYTRFDLLTLLTAGAVSRVAVNALALQVQPSPDASSAAVYVWAGLALAAVAGLVIAARGRPVDLAEAASQIAIGASIVEDRADRERLRAEFDLARRVQEQMLPPIPPAIDGFALAASCRPAREVGGDLYDFIRIDDRRYLMAVADVSGKGVPAALFMTMTKGLVGAVVEQVDEPERIAWSMNEHLYETCARRIFVTAAIGVLNTATRTFRYTRAGHNPPIWRRSRRQETRLLRKGGVGLGLVGPRMFNPRTSTEVIQLEPADALILYSDGIVEAMNPAREEYGEERLVQTIERSDHLDAAALRDAILADVQAFVAGAAAHDDMTLLVMRAS